MHTVSHSDNNLSSTLSAKPASPAPVGALHKEAPLIIKQASAEKPKQAKKDKVINLLCKNKAYRFKMMF